MLGRYRNSCTPITEQQLKEIKAGTTSWEVAGLKPARLPVQQLSRVAAHDAATTANIKAPRHAPA